ncbi:MAG: hypothetical protein RIQ60_3520 [Pseudomonadota bacterium]|jgi:hypothetical protein
MNTVQIRQTTRRHLVTCSAIGSLALCSAVLVACGGGGGVGVTGTGSGPTNFTAGAVTGKGSTIVNGVRFDDSGTKVIEDANDDSAGSTNRVSDDVKVGMEVEIEHGVVTCSTDTSGNPSSATAITNCSVTPTATASKVSFGGNSMVGDISAVSSTGFTLFGQTVTINAATVVSGGPLADGQVVEVHGSYDAVNRTLTATRVEVKAANRADAQTGGVVLRVRGTLVVTGSTSATIGGLTVDLNGQSTTGFDGTVVRAKLSYDTPPKVASAFKSGVRKLDDHKGAKAELEGTAEGVNVEPNGDVTFTINGSPVRVSASTVLLPSGSKLTDLASGVRVEVEGSVAASSSDATVTELKATTLKFKKAEDEGGLPVELHGNVDSIDLNAKTFVIRGVTVAYNDASFSGNGNSSKKVGSLSALQLLVGVTSKTAQVEVKASSVGGVMTAKSIKMDN